MTPTVIATIILIATVIMFFSPKIPTTATALVGTIAMAAFGILPAKVSLTTTAPQPVC